MGKKNQSKHAKAQQGKGKQASQAKSNQPAQSKSQPQPPAQLNSYGAAKKQKKAKHCSSYNWSDAPEYVAHLAKFKDQIKQYNITIHDVIGDGNCLFRSFADILDGNENEHMKYRDLAVKEMKKNEAHYKPFLFDQTYESYLAEISISRNWAGNLELQALANALNLTCFVHMVDRPIMIIKPQHYTQKTPTIHIAYHLNEEIPEHYSAIRNMNDINDHPAAPIKHPAFLGLESKILAEIKRQQEEELERIDQKKKSQKPSAQKTDQGTAQKAQQEQEEEEARTKQTKPPAEQEELKTGQSQQQAKKEEETIEKQEEKRQKEEKEEEKKEQKPVRQDQPETSRPEEKDKGEENSAPQDEAGQSQAAQGTEFNYPRNKKCYCGSFLPFKKCCMKLMYKQQQMQENIVSQKGAVLI